MLATFLALMTSLVRKLPLIWRGTKWQPNEISLWSKNPKWNDQLVKPFDVSSGDFATLKYNGPVFKLSSCDINCLYLNLIPRNDPYNDRVKQIRRNIYIKEINVNKYASFMTPYELMPLVKSLSLKNNISPKQWTRISEFLGILQFLKDCNAFNCGYTHVSLRWRHNGPDSVSNHQPHDCLLNRLFRQRSKKTSKLRVTGLCARKSPGTGEFPAQIASYAENVSIWWRHHVFRDETHVPVHFVEW